MSVPDVEPRYALATVSLDGLPTVAVLRGEEVVPLGELVTTAHPPTSVRNMLSDWDGWCDAVEQALDRRHYTAWQNPDSVHFMPPIPDPPTVYCCGANYADHVSEMGRVFERERPIFFVLPPAALVGHRGDVLRPPVDIELDWEAELVVVIGSTIDNASPAAAGQAIAGYTIGNDISLRGEDPEVRHSHFGHRWIERKGRRTMLPLGPGVVPARLVPDPSALDISLSVNGEERQHSNTGLMLDTITDQIVYISSFVPLMPGDLIFTGTPAGTGAAHGHFLSVGDALTVRISGLGELTNTIAAPG